MILIVGLKHSLSHTLRYVMIGLHLLKGDEILTKALITGFKFQHNIHVTEQQSVRH